MKCGKAQDRGFPEYFSRKGKTETGLEIPEIPDLALQLDYYPATLFSVDTVEAQGLYADNDIILFLSSGSRHNLSMLTNLVIAKLNARVTL